MWIWNSNFNITLFWNQLQTFLIFKHLWKWTHSRTPFIYEWSNCMLNSHTKKFNLITVKITKIFGCGWTKITIIFFYSNKWSSMNRIKTKENIDLRWEPFQLNLYIKHDTILILQTCMLGKKWLQTNFIGSLLTMVG